MSQKPKILRRALNLIYKALQVYDKFMTSMTKLSTQKDDLGEEVYNQAMEFYGNGTYVGETSRVFRSRIFEHMKATRNLNKDSFIVEHWQDKHGTSMSPPAFCFKALRGFKDCLSRQLYKALSIKEQGRLNRKQEYITNELVKLEASLYSWEADRQNEEENKSKKTTERVGETVC